MGADPFLLLKEVVEMSKYARPTAASSAHVTSETQMKADMNRKMYDAMVEKNF